jgi:hypothetical protein
MDSVRFILLCLAGWINRQQQDAIAYLQEEVAVLREHLEHYTPTNSSVDTTILKDAAKIGFSATNAH